MSESISPSSSPQEHLSGCLARLVWLLVGNLGLLFCAIAITRSKERFFSAADLAFSGVVVVLLVVRLLDIRLLQGRTSDNQSPATMRHWRRYAAGLLVVSAVVWGVAHALARSGQ